jgi:hypothetical protein
MNRRDLLRRGAIVGGSLLWVAPVVQSLSPRAAASTTGSPIFGCCECRNGAVGKELCNPGQDHITCTTSGSGQPQGSGPASSITDCQSYCAGQGQAFCFHSGATPLSCIPGSNDRSFCTGD